MIAGASQPWGPLSWGILVSLWDYFAADSLFPASSCLQRSVPCSHYPVLLKAGSTLITVEGVSLSLQCLEWFHNQPGTLLTAAFLQHPEFARYMLAGPCHCCGTQWGQEAKLAW